MASFGPLEALRRRRRLSTSSALKSAAQATPPDRLCLWGGCWLLVVADDAETASVHESRVSVSEFPIPFPCLCDSRSACGFLAKVSCDCEQDCCDRILSCAGQPRQRRQRGQRGHWSGCCLKKKHQQLAVACPVSSARSGQRCVRDQRVVQPEFLKVPSGPSS
jgi:hypothetical protein